MRFSLPSYFQASFQPMTTLLLVSSLLSPVTLHANGCGSCGSSSSTGSGGMRSPFAKAFPTLNVQFGGRDVPRTIPRVRWGSDGVSTVTVMQKGVNNVTMEGNETRYAAAGRGGGEDQPLPGVSSTTSASAAEGGAGGGQTSSPTEPPPNCPQPGSGASVTTPDLT